MLMTKEIMLGGQKRPIRFGMAALLRYEELTGRAAVSDFAAATGGSYSLQMVVDLVLAGLECGYKKEGLPATDLDRYDVADWLGEEVDAIENIVQMFADSLPKPKNGNPPARKKA